MRDEGPENPESPIAKLIVLRPWYFPFWMWKIKARWVIWKELRRMRQRIDNSTS